MTANQSPMYSNDWKSPVVRFVTRKKMVFLFVTLAFVPVHVSHAQSFQYFHDQPGKFIFSERFQNSPEADLPVLQKKLASVVEWVRLNDAMLTRPAGFDALVHLRVFTEAMKTDPAGYGIQSSIDIVFHHYYIENGIVQRATGNTAHGTAIAVNNPIRDISTRFDEAGFKTGDPQHLKQPLENALQNLRRYYTTMPVIKEYAPGVRLYAPSPGTWFKGTLFVFDPDQPDIWIPVTVKEIMEAKLAYYKVKHEIDSISYGKMVATWAKLNYNPDPEQKMRPQLYQMIKKEYESFTTEELNRQAYVCPGEECGISSVNARGEGRAVVRFNPACWDRSLPVTAVQFMTMEFRTASEQEMEGFRKRNGGLEDYVGMFYNNLPVEKMAQLVDRN